MIHVNNAETIIDLIAILENWKSFSVYKGNIDFIEDIEIDGIQYDYMYFREKFDCFAQKQKIYSGEGLDHHLYLAVYYNDLKSKTIINEFLQWLKVKRIEAESFVKSLTPKGIIEFVKLNSHGIMEKINLIQQEYKYLSFTQKNQEDIIKFNLGRALSKDVYNKLFKLKGITNEKIREFIVEQMTIKEPHRNNELADLIELLCILRDSGSTELNIINPGSRDVTINFKYDNTIKYNFFVCKGTEFNIVYKYIGDYATKAVASKFWNFYNTKKYHAIKFLFDEEPLFFTGHSYGALFSEVLYKKYITEYPEKKENTNLHVYARPWGELLAQGKKEDYNGYQYFKDGNIISSFHEGDPVANKVGINILKSVGYSILSFWKEVKLMEYCFYLSSLLAVFYVGKATFNLFKKVKWNKILKIFDNHKISIFAKDHTYHHKDKTELHAQLTWKESYKGLGIIDDILLFLNVINGDYGTKIYIHSSDEREKVKNDNINRELTEKVKLRYEKCINEGFNFNKILASCIIDNKGLNLSRLFSNPHLKYLCEINYNDTELNDMKILLESFFKYIDKLKINNIYT